MFGNLNNHAWSAYVPNSSYCPGRTENSRIPEPRACNFILVLCHVHRYHSQEPSFQVSFGTRATILSPRAKIIRVEVCCWLANLVLRENQPKSDLVLGFALTQLFNLQEYGRVPSLFNFPTGLQVPDFLFFDCRVRVSRRTVLTVALLIHNTIVIIIN